MRNDAGTGSAPSSSLTRNLAPGGVGVAEESSPVKVGVGAATVVPAEGVRDSLPSVRLGLGGSTVPEAAATGVGLALRGLVRVDDGAAVDGVLADGLGGAGTVGAGLGVGGGCVGATTGGGPSVPVG